MTGFLSPGLVGTDLDTLLPVSPLGAAEIVRAGNCEHLVFKKTMSKYQRTLLLSNIDTRIIVVHSTSVLPTGNQIKPKKRIKTRTKLPFKTFKNGQIVKCHVWLQLRAC